MFTLARACREPSDPHFSSPEPTLRQNSVLNPSLGPIGDVC